MVNIYYKKIENKKIDLERFPIVLKEHLLNKKNEKNFLESYNVWEMTRIVLEDYYDIILTNENLKFSNNGKPLVSTTNISIAHSNSLVILAVSNNNIGIDIEYVDENINAKKMIDRLCKHKPKSVGELHYFLKAFTQFEATIKFNDKVLTYPKKKLVVDNTIPSFILNVDDEKYMVSVVGDTEYFINEM